MSDTEKMLETLQEMYFKWFTGYPKAEGTCLSIHPKHEFIREYSAIRARLLAYDKLKKRVEEWGKLADKALGEYGMENDVWELAYKVRDHREGE